MQLTVYCDLLRTIPFNRRALNSVARTNYLIIGSRPPGPTVQIIPINRQHPKTIVQTIPVSK